MSINNKIYSLLITIVCFSQIVHAQSPELLYREGITALEQGKTEKAIRIFEEISSKGYESAALYNNLGTSYLHENKKGLAILNYEKALLISPTNHQIQRNWFTARSSIIGEPLQKPEVTIFSQLKLFLYSIAIDELAIAGVSMLIFALCLLGLNLQLKRKSIHLAGKTFFFLSIVALAAASLQFYFRISTCRAVVLDEKIIVKTAASLHAKDAYILQEGKVVEILDNFESWSKVSWAENEKGWVKSNSLKNIALSQ